MFIIAFFIFIIYAFFDWWSKNYLCWVFYRLGEKLFIIPEFILDDVFNFFHVETPMPLWDRIIFQDKFYIRACYHWNMFWRIVDQPGAWIHIVIWGLFLIGYFENLYIRLEDFFWFVYYRIKVRVCRKDPCRTSPLLRWYYRTHYVTVFRFVYYLREDINLVEWDIRAIFVSHYNYFFTFQTFIIYSRFLFLVEPYIIKLLQFFTLKLVLFLHVTLIVLGYLDFDLFLYNNIIFFYNSYLSIISTNLFSVLSELNIFTWFLALNLYISPYFLMYNLKVDDGTNLDINNLNIPYFNVHDTHLFYNANFYVICNDLQFSLTPSSFNNFTGITFNFKDLPTYNYLLHCSTFNLELHDNGCFLSYTNNNQTTSIYFFFNNINLTDFIKYYNFITTCNSINNNEAFYLVFCFLHFNNQRIPLSLIEFYSIKHSETISNSLSLSFFSSFYFSTAHFNNTIYDNNFLFYYNDFSLYFNNNKNDFTYLHDSSEIHLLDYDGMNFLNVFDDCLDDLIDLENLTFMYYLYNFRELDLHRYFVLLFNDPFVILLTLLIIIFIVYLIYLLIDIILVFIFLYFISIFLLFLT